MTYVKQTWVNGPAGATPISAARLSYIESGLETTSVRVNSEGPLSLLDPRVGAISGGGNAATNDAAWAAAIAILPATGGEIYVPPGTWQTSAPIVPKSGMTIRGASRDSSIIRNFASDVLSWSAATLRHFTLQNITLRAEGTNTGHVVNALHGLSQSTIFNCRLLQKQTAKRLWNQEYTAGGYIDNTVFACELEGVSGHSVPLWYMKSSLGDLNSNTWKRLRCTFSGDYFFHIEQTNSSQYTYDNCFEDINFEVCNGGCIRGLSAQGWELHNLYVYDLGTVTQDLFHIGRSSGGTGGPGPGSRENVFRKVRRIGGTMGTFNDISFPGGQGVSRNNLEYCGSTSDGNLFVVDLGGTSSVAIGMNTGVTWKNATALTRFDRSGMVIAEDTNLKRVAADILGTDDDFECATVGKGMILKSPNGTRYRLTVSDAGAVSSTLVT